MRKLLAAALLAALALATPAVAQTTACPDPNPPPVEPAPDAALQAALDRINALRRQAGVAPVALDARLNRAAQLHAEDMAARRYFSHTSLDGRNAGQRITATGYAWRGWGENIAMGQTTWDAAISAWMGSAGHRRNILNPSWRHMGLGTKDRRWVQVFAIPR